MGEGKVLRRRFVLEIAYVESHLGGGPTRVIQELRNGIRKSITDWIPIVFFCKTEHHDYKDGQPRTNVPTWLFAGAYLVHVVYDMLRSMVRLRKRVKQLELVHCHDFFSVIIARLALGPRVPILLTVHSPGSAVDELVQRHPSLRGKTVERVLRRLEVEAFRLSKCIVTPSNAVWDMLLKRYQLLGALKGRHTVIYNSSRSLPQPTPGAAASVRQELKLLDNAVTFIAVGRLEPVRGFDVLLEAFALVIRQEPSVSLLVAGVGSQREALEARSNALGITEKVRFLGQRSDVELLLQVSQVFVSPARSEAFSLALLEAMSLGVAVIATAVGGNLEIVDDGKNGLLVRPEDPAQLASAMLKLIRVPSLRHQLGVQAQCTVQERFSQNTMVSRHLALYGDLVGGT